MKQPAAVVTMVKDDYVFLRKWVAYYGGCFGRKALHVVNHGGDPEVDRIADGCNVIHIPGDFDGSFDAKRWRFLSNLTNALRSYYEFVICGDVDEYLVVDPQTGLTLPEFLRKRNGRMVLTPIGIEVVHRAGEEPEDIEPTILGARRFGRYSSLYCKPCATSTAIRFSRGGHYSDHAELKVFRNLYLFHMKYCDRPLTVETKRRRAALAESTLDAAGNKTSKLSDRWFGEDAGELDTLAALPVRADFDLAPRVAEMEQSWGPREGGFFHFRKLVGNELYTIPDRFAGIV
jgi:hypothetical protein